MMKTVWIDCSYLCHHVTLNTGIQRVVRNVIIHLKPLAEASGFNVVPVDISNGQFRPLDIKDLSPALPESAVIETKTTILQKVKVYLRGVYGAVRGLLAALFPFSAFHRFLFAPRSQWGLSFICDSITLKPLRFLKKRFNQITPKEDASSVCVSSEDKLLLLDSTWYSNIWPSVEKLKESGVHVSAVSYDLIPITHPQFCDDFLAQVFKQWFFDSLNYVDCYIAISHTIQKDLMRFLEANGKDTTLKKFDYFHLGADIKIDHNATLEIRQEFNEMLKYPTYLIVSTVEPRKNHEYLLDAFEILWQNNYQVNLCIVGRVGWKVEKTMERILSHTYFKKYLWMWNDVSDHELNYLYKHSKMLLFPSIVEGFGLPIVESLAHGLPVIASNTPIHKEVGGEQIDYFDLSEPSSLVNKIMSIEKNGIPEKLRVPQNYHWLNWAQSTQMLWQKMLSNA